MPHIHSLREGLPVFRALSSPIRIDILELLYREGPMSMGAIARQLGMTSAALTPHAKALADCGLIAQETTCGRHGLQKRCIPMDERIVIDPARQHRDCRLYEAEIGVGQYATWDVAPTCGICTREKVIGQVDAPRFFASPEHFGADVLWFSHGYVEYMLPCFLQPQQEPVELQLSMELSSEAPGYAECWPSDVYFSLNGVPLGYWTSPGDYGRVPGIYNPPWWHREWNQHGLYAMLCINKNGAYVNGVRIGDATLQQLNLQPGKAIPFRIESPESTEHCGGVTLFGHAFGNYPQDIRMRLQYKENSDL